MVQEVYQEILLNLPWVFENVVLADEPFTIALRILEMRVLFNGNLCGKLVSLLDSSTAFDERFKVTWAVFFIPDLN